MSKGDATRERILDRAFLLAGRDGLEGVTIGALADELGLSKSGLFAHFGSKEELQIGVLDVASSRFTEKVLLPAFKAPRGLPRLERIFENWVAWMTDPKLPGGCLFPQAIAELDDKPGRPRDALVEAQRGLVDALAHAAQLAIDQGHLRKGTDPEQFAYELYGVVIMLNTWHRLFRDKKGVERARSAFQRLVKSHAP